MKKTSQPPQRDKPLRLGLLGSSIAFNLRRAHTIALQVFSRQIGQGYGRPGRFTILTLIAENPGLTQTELGRASGLDISTLTPALNDLVRRGLVSRRRPAGDRRTYSLKITARGAAIHSSLQEEAERFEMALARAVGTRNKHALLTLLRRIAAMAQPDTQPG
jgi:DNA-binding MarR family transcriptional regulator